MYALGTGSGPDPMYALGTGPGPDPMSWGRGRGQTLCMPWGRGRGQTVVFQARWDFHAAGAGIPARTSPPCLMQAQWWCNGARCPKLAGELSKGRKGRKGEEGGCHGVRAPLSPFWGPERWKAHPPTAMDNDAMGPGSHIPLSPL